MVDFYVWWLSLFFLTEIFETPIAWGILSQGRVSSTRALASVLLASVWTHPILFSLSWFVVPRGHSYFFWIISLELVVVCAEAWWHRYFLGVSWQLAWTASLMANCVSFGAGLLFMNASYL